MLCIYCGDRATSRDHVPPRCETPGVTATYPACSDCNSGILGGRPLMTVEARRAYVAGALRGRLARHPGARWSRDELAELGPSLRTSVEQYLTDYHRLVTRAAHAAA